MVLGCELEVSFAHLGLSVAMPGGGEEAGEEEKEEEEEGTKNHAELLYVKLTLRLRWQGPASRTPGLLTSREASCPPLSSTPPEHPSTASPADDLIGQLNHVTHHQIT